VRVKILAFGDESIPPRCRMKTRGCHCWGGAQPFAPRPRRISDVAVDSCIQQHSQPREAESPAKTPSKWTILGTPGCHVPILRDMGSPQATRSNLRMLVVAVLAVALFRKPWSCLLRDFYLLLIFFCFSVLQHLTLLRFKISKIRRPSEGRLQRRQRACYDKSIYH